MILPADVLEWRRLRALHLKRQGWSGRDIAEALTPGGKLYTLVRQESFDGTHVIEFLVHLLRATGRGCW